MSLNEVNIITNLTRNVVLADRVELARTFREKFRGLRGRERLTPGEALVIRRCRQIDTIRMRFPIDVLFIERAGEVVGAISDMQPSCMTRVYWSSANVAELPAGTLEQTGTGRGDIVRLD